jgi:hypothetical protein
MTGYLLTTAISRAVWKGRTLWLYSTLAVVLFILHFELLNVGIGCAFAPIDRLRIILAGICAAAITTLVEPGGRRTKISRAGRTLLSDAFELFFDLVVGTDLEIKSGRTRASASTPISHVC